MGTVYLIRHGQASYGETDYDRLSWRGFEQATLLGRWLARARIDALYHGPLRRQRETASSAMQAAAALGIALPEPVEIPAFAEYPAFEMLQHLVPRLAEVDPKFAALTNAPTPRLLDEAFHTILAKWGDDEWVVHGMERVGEFVERVRGGLTRIVEAAGSGARIACVTSAGPIGVAVGLTFGIPDARMVRTSIVIRNASVTELKFRSTNASWSPDQVSLVTFNVTAHLTDEMQTER